MDNPPEALAVHADEQPCAVGVSIDRPNEVGNPGQTNTLAALSEEFASLEVDEHPQGDEIRRQVSFSPHHPSRLQSDICRWNTTFPTGTWLPMNISWPLAAAL